jgi:hypothetical protein
MVNAGALQGCGRVNVVKIDQSFPNPSAIVFDMKKQPSLKMVQAVHCRTCGAAPGQKCELGTGQPRTEPHRDRKNDASDFYADKKGTDRGTR